MAVSQYLRSDTSTLLLYVVGSFIVYLGSLAVYRMYFDPLSHVPGPKLAAATFFYEFYWDVIQPGRLTWHLNDLHDLYGPIVRITPDEVHIRDSQFFDELYARSSGKRHKLPRFSGRFGFKQESFSTWENNLHRMRRAAINPFFSVQKVTKLQPIVRTNLTKLTKILVAAAETGKTIPINLAFMALIGDVTTTYAFAQPYNQLDSPGFTTTYDETFKALYTLGNFCVHFPGIFKLIDICPPWLTNILNPTIMPIVTFYADCERSIHNIRTGINKSAVNADHLTIFHEMLLSEHLPPEEKTDRRLSEEAVEIVAAGIITTSTALTTAVYHLATNPAIQFKLHAELRVAIPHPLNPSNLESNRSQIDWHALESLPYLGACVREAIRVSAGTANRSPRLNPDGALVYKSYTIPSGYAMSMTTFHINRDPTIFPDPETFNPSHWLRDDGTRNPEMDRWIVAFGKGPRQCAGMNLAWAELYVTLAVLVREFELVDAGTDWERDVEIKHAYLVPYPDLKRSKGVKITVKKVEG